MRIRSRLLLLALAVLAPAIVGAAFGLAYLYKEERQFNYASMQETARALALALDREMARRESVLRTLGRLVMPAPTLTWPKRQSRSAERTSSS